MANAITRLITRLHGVLVGEDAFGNRYYHDRNPARRPPRRWVVYGHQDDDASRIPAEYHAWLHQTTDDFPSGNPATPSWRRPHRPNRTGTPDAYRPTGHTLQNGQRPSATGDYQAWSPD